jgi:hypothetical protein
MADDGKQTFVLYRRLLWIWLAILTLANCFRAVRNGLLICATFLADVLPDKDWRRHIESLLSAESLETHDIILFVYNLTFSLVLLALIISFSRQKRWSLQALRWGLTLDVLLLPILTVTYRWLGYAHLDMDPLRAGAVYAILVEVPAIVLLGHPRLREVSESLGQSGRKDRNRKEGP